uniref:Succinyl-CoA ligase [ADP-forming] subunit beta n=1 Tax=Anthurium amnicola TaxID=1678845 RepID=A0A1D1Z1M8_9ARAE
MEPWTAHMLGSSNSHDFRSPMETASLPLRPAMPCSSPPLYSQRVPDSVAHVISSGDTSFSSTYTTMDELKSYIRKVISESVAVPKSRSTSNYCKLPPVFFPPGFKVPNYRKYDGMSDPRHHFASFVMDSQQFMHDKALTVHLFQKSLEGEALMWFASLSASELTSFRTVVERFMSRFGHITCQAPTLFDLVSEKMSPDEDFIDYVNRWGNMASGSEIAIPESQAVAMIINNATPQLRDILMFSELRTLSQLCSRGKVVQAQIRESMTPVPTTEDHVIGKLVSTLQCPPSRPNSRSILAPAPALQLLRPMPAQGQHTTVPSHIAIGNPQPSRQGQQSIQNLSCSKDLEQITSVASNGPIRDQRTQMWSYEGEDQDEQMIMTPKEEVERPLQLIWPCGQRQEEPMDSRPFVLIYPEVPAFPDSQIMTRSPPCIHEAESRPLQLILPPGSVYQSQGEVLPT